MKNIEDVKTIEDILEAEKEMIPLAEEKYGDSFKNAADFNNLLNNFLSEAGEDAWIFVVFLSQIKKHHTLALFSSARLHHIQAMLNLRQVLEAGVNAAYGLANPTKEDFVIKKGNDALDVSDVLDKKRYKWLELYYHKHSDFIKTMKQSINKSCAHSNMIYAMDNFSMADYKFKLSFFDKAEEHLVKTDFWMIGNIALGLMDLFREINKSVNRITFAADFTSRLEDLEKKNHTLKDEAKKHPRFQHFSNRDYH